MKWPVAVLMIAAIAACDSTKPDVAPTLSLATADSVATAAVPVHLDIAMHDDHGLSRLTVGWGDGVGDTATVTGRDETTTLAHSFAAVGSFTVSATLEDDHGQTTSASATITVGPAVVVLSPASDTLNAIGFTTTLEAEARDADGSAVTAPITWQSLSPSVATVSSAGVVTSVAAGVAQIRAGAGRVADTATVLVRQVPATLLISLPQDTLGVRESVQLAATVQDSNQVAIPDLPVAWTSLAPTLLSVDSTGMIRGLAEGTGTLAAVAGPVGDTADVEVLLMLLYAQDTDPQPDLMTMSSHGTAVRNLSQKLRDATGAEGGGTNGAWSPDRSEIVFWNTYLPSGALWIMKSDGSDVHMLETGLAVAYAPDWSPDGTKIVFAGRSDGGARDDIYVINVDGTGLTPVAADTAQETHPRWSPDGNKIAYERVVNGNPDIFVVDADGSNPTNLTQSTSTEVSPVWSPDGTEIAFSSDRSGTAAYVIHRMNADGSNIRQIGDLQGTQLDWSPDGSRFAFAAYVNGVWDLYVMNIDGSGLTRLTDTALAEQDVRWR